MSSLYPKRRAEDQTDHSAIGRLLTFTDLMALLLCFFIMLYATRDPDQQRMQQAFAPNIAPLVVPVSQEDAEIQNSKTLAKPGIGLDLNYIAGLLLQARERDDNLSGIVVRTHEHALEIVTPKGDLKTLQSVLNRVGTYRRTVGVFAPQPIMDALLAQKTDANFRYFPQDSRATPVILIH